MLDRALTKTFDNLSTLMLLACLFTIPIHISHAFAFKDVLAVQEIAPEIQQFPEGRQVRGVAKEDLDKERNWMLLCLGLEALLIPLVYKGARRVIEVADEGGVPTVTDALAHLRGTGRASLQSGPLMAAVFIGAAVAGLVWVIGGSLADMASADVAWAIIGVSRGLSVASFLAVILGVAASLPVSAIQRPAEQVDLY
jgi:hypothetical protein